MSIDSLRRRLLRLHTAKADFRHGLAAARANRMALRAEKIRQCLPADLTPEERIAELRGKLADWSKGGEGLEYAGDSKLGRRMFDSVADYLKVTERTIYRLAAAKKTQPSRWGNMAILARRDRPMDQTVVQCR